MVGLHVIWRQRTINAPWIVKFEVFCLFFVFLFHQQSLSQFVFVFPVFELSLHLLLVLLHFLLDLFLFLVHFLLAFLEYFLVGLLPFGDFGLELFVLLPEPHLVGLPLSILVKNEDLVLLLDGLSDFELVLALVNEVLWEEILDKVEVFGSLAVFVFLADFLVISFLLFLLVFLSQVLLILRLFFLFLLFSQTVLIPGQFFDFLLNVVLLLDLFKRPLDLLRLQHLVDSVHNNEVQLFLHLQFLHPLLSLNPRVHFVMVEPVFSFPEFLQFCCVGFHLLLNNLFLLI